MLLIFSCLLRSSRIGLGRSTSFRSCLTVISNQAMTLALEKKGSKLQLHLFPPVIVFPLHSLGHPLSPFLYIAPVFFFFSSFSAPQFFAISRNRITIQFHPLISVIVMPLLATPIPPFLPFFLARSSSRSLPSPHFCHFFAARSHSQQPLLYFHLCSFLAAHPSS